VVDNLLAQRFYGFSNALNVGMHLMYFFKILLCVLCDISAGAYACLLLTHYDL